MEAHSSFGSPPNADFLVVQKRVRILSARNKSNSRHATAFHNAAVHAFTSSARIAYDNLWYKNKRASDWTATGGNAVRDRKHEFDEKVIIV